MQQTPIRNTRASSRNNAQIMEPQCRLTSYKKSFFPDCIRIWNALKNETVNSTSISIFNAHILSLPAFAHCRLPGDALQYNKTIKGHTGRLITQFRLGLSPLRNELFTYNITDNPFCPSCGQNVETHSHFLFECSLYSQQRYTMLNDLKMLITHVNIQFNLQIDSDKNDDIKCMLINGLNMQMLDDSVGINAAIFNIASTYISSTARFK